MIQVKRLLAIAFGLIQKAQFLTAAGPKPLIYVNAEADAPASAAYLQFGYAHRFACR